MQARRPVIAAFRGGAATVLLLLLWCAPDANASKIAPDCPHERAERQATLDVHGSDLEAPLVVSAMPPAEADSRSVESAYNPVPPDSEFEAAMTRILEASMARAGDDGRHGAEDADASPDASPIIEADVDIDAAESAPAVNGWTSESARLPGLSDAAAERYRRQMYRTDI